MDVEKVIRVLGYIVYTILWSPIIMLALIVTPIVWVALYVRAGRPVNEAIKSYSTALLNSIHHDIDFIQTGKW